MSIRSLTDSPVGGVGSQIETPPKDSVQSPGLDQIKGSATPPSGANRPPQVAPPSDGDKALATVSAQANPLDGLSKKSDALFSGLPDSLKQALSDRLDQADKPTESAIKKLLHFDWDDKSGASKAGRLAIRETLTAAIAGGMDLAAAKTLRTHLTGLSDRQLSHLSTEMRKPDASLTAVLSRNLMQPGQPQARETFAALRDVMIAFPPDPALAGKAEVLDELMVIRRDDQGKLHYTHVSAGLAPLSIPDSNKGLDAQKIDDIKQLFLDAAEARYGRGGLVLDFVRTHARECSQANQAHTRAPSMGDTLKQYQPDGKGIAAKYDRADCMSLADQLVKDLAAQGIKAHIAGYWNGDLIGKNPDKGLLSEVRDATSRVTHTDVLIPYTDAQGKEKVLLLVPGMGDDPKYFESLDPGDAKLLGRSLKPDGDGLDVATQQKLQMGWMTNIQILNNTWASTDRNLFGIDIANGKFYLNGSASADFTKAHRGGASDTGASISFDFAKVAKDPMATTTVKIWDDTQGAYQDKAVAGFQALTLFLRAVQDQFGQPPEFVREMMGLVAHRDDYVRDVLLPTVAAKVK